MKTQLKALTAAMGLGLALASGSAMAESTYGYNATTPASAVTATAKLQISVNIPKLILLRVGSAGATVDDVVFTATPNVQTVPGPLSTNGDSQAATWDGVAPTFAATTASTNPVHAYLWHNASGGATLSCAVSTAFANGLTAADVTVSSSGALAHPGGATDCGTPTTGLVRNTLFTGDWTFDVSSTGMAAAAAGADFEVVTYTAVTL